MSSCPLERGIIFFELSRTLVVIIKKKNRGVKFLLGQRNRAEKDRHVVIRSMPGDEVGKGPIAFRGPASVSDPGLLLLGGSSEACKVSC